MAINQNDLEILKTQNMTDASDGGGLPSAVPVADGKSNNLFSDVSDIDRLMGRVRLRKIILAVMTGDDELLQATRLLFTELPENPNISVFAFKATSFADIRSDAQNRIESYLAFGTKWAGHLLETQLVGQRVIQISLDPKDAVPAVGQPLVLVQNEGQSDEYYQYIRPLKVETVDRRFQKNSQDTVTRTIATIEFGDTLTKPYNGLTVPEFYANANTSRRAILREARVADAAKYYSASRLAEPVVAMQSRQVRINSIYTQVVPSTQVETPILQRDPANQIATQARGKGSIAISQSVNVTNNTSFSLPSGIAVGSLSISVAGQSLTDRDGQLVNGNNLAFASVKYGSGQITWYSSLNLGYTTITGSYTPASEFIRVAQTDYQVVDDNAGYNFVRELGAEPVQNSLKISYTVQGSNYFVHDDGRGNLIDDDGNGRGTIQGKTVLLTTAAIPDAASYIVYSFGVDLDTVKYAAQALMPAYHSGIIADEVVGDITVTWGTNKTATISNGVITGDATGTFSAKEIRIAPKETVAKDTVFTVTYSKVLESMTTSINSVYSVENSNGVFSGNIDLGSAIEKLSFTVQLDNKSGAQVLISLGVDSGGTKLAVLGVYYASYMSSSSYSGNMVFMNSRLSWTPYANYSGDDWQPTLVSSSVNKSTGTASFSLKVARKQTITNVVMSGGINIQPLFSTKTVDTNMFIQTATVNGTATVGGVTEQATISMKAEKLFIAPPQASDTPVVNGSVFIDALGKSLRDDNGKIKDNTGVVGEISIKSGVVQLDKWTAGVLNNASLKSMLRENDPVPLANVVFRTPVSPLKKSSLQISAELSDGTVLSLSTDGQGKITGSKYAHGTVDFKAGFVALYFYEKLGVTANPSVVNESWYSIDNIYTETATGNTQFINKPVYVKPDSIRYNAIAYSYLPLDSSLIGLDPVRLPSDGRVPFVRKGDSIAITELKSVEIPISDKNTSYDLGFERLSDVTIFDSLGKKVSYDYLVIDLDAGTIFINDLYPVETYTAPLTAKYRVMDIALVIEADISGRVTLSTPITHDYTTAAVFSSMLLAGDMQARAYNVFSQKSWGKVFSNTLIGDRAESQLQTATNPIVVLNRDAIEERWALVFTSATEFRIIGETVGEIGVGSTTLDTAPLNPVTSYPYFKIPRLAWGAGWAANNVLRFNTGAAKYPVWIGNAIQQHVGSSKDNYDFTIGYHANIDRDRVEGQ